MAEQIEWRPVVGYEGAYEVSSVGQVRSLDRVRPNKVRPGRIKGRLLKPDDSRAYYAITLCKDGGLNKMPVHRIVAEAFIGPRPDGYWIDHINLNKRDNRASNLRYVTPAENRENVPVLAASGFKHVHYCSCLGGKYEYAKPWQARVRRVYLGMYASPEEAANAVREYLSAA
jgi:hypothetical protein